MSGTDNLQRRQFTPHEVEAHVPGAFDGHHRMHAATALGIRHGTAYVRVNRPAF